MDKMNAPRKRAVILACLALSGLVCCTTEQGNFAVAAESDKSQKGRADYDETAVAKKTERVLKKARQTWMDKNGECNKAVLKIYKSEIQALEAQKEALNRVNKAKREEQKRLEDKSQRLDRKMLEFEDRKIKQPTPNQQWHSYEMFVLLWRNVKFKLREVEETQIEIKHLKQRCAKQIDPIQDSFKTCEDFLLNW